MKMPKRLGVQTVSLRFMLDELLLSRQVVYLWPCLVCVVRLGVRVDVDVDVDVLSPEYAEAGWKSYLWREIGYLCPLMCSSPVHTMFPFDTSLRLSQLIDPR